MNHIKKLVLTFCIIVFLGGCGYAPVNMSKGYIPIGFEFTDNAKEIKTTIVQDDGCLINANGTYDKSIERINFRFTDINCTQTKGLVVGEDRIYGIKPKVKIDLLKKQEQYLKCLYDDKLTCDLNDSSFKSFLVEAQTKVYLLRE